MRQQNAELFTLCKWKVSSKATVNVGQVFAIPRFALLFFPSNPTSPAIVLCCTPTTSLSPLTSRLREVIRTWIHVDTKWSVESGGARITRTQFRFFSGFHFYCDVAELFHISSPSSHRFAPFFWWKAFLTFLSVLSRRSRQLFWLCASNFCLLPFNRNFEAKERKRKNPPQLWMAKASEQLNSSSRIQFFKPLGCWLLKSFSAAFANSKQIRILNQFLITALDFCSWS